MTKDEIVKAVTSDKIVIQFLRSCGEANLQFLLQPARLGKALDVLDTSKDGELDIDEWEEAIHRGLAKRIEDLKAEQERRARAEAAADEAFSAEFLSMARMVFDMIDADESGTLVKTEIVRAVEARAVGNSSRRGAAADPGAGRGDAAARRGSPADRGGSQRRRGRTRRRRRIEAVCGDAAATTMSRPGRRRGHDDVAARTTPGRRRGQDDAAAKMTPRPG